VENCPVSMVLWLSSSCEFMIVFCFVFFVLFQVVDELRYVYIFWDFELGSSE